MTNIFREASEAIEKLQAKVQEQAALITALLTAVADDTDKLQAQAAEIEFLTENCRGHAANFTDSQHKVKVLTDAIDNLVQQKGRHNTEIAYKRLVEALAAVKGE